MVGFQIPTVLWKRADKKTALALCENFFDEVSKVKFQILTVYRWVFFFSSWNFLPTLPSQGDQRNLKMMVAEGKNC